MKPPDAPTEPMPVTFVQQLCYRSKQLDPRAGLQASGVRLRDADMLAAWQAFFREWQAASDALRTTFRRDERTGSIVGTLHEQPTDPIVLLPGRTDLASAQAQVQRCLADHVSQVDELPLSRHYTVPLDDGSYFVLVVSEHIIHDGGTVETTFAGLVEIVAGRNPVELLTRARPYRDYAQIERELVTGPVATGRLRWWERRLDGTQPLRLPVSGSRNGPARGAFGPVYQSTSWPPAGLDEAVSPFDVVCAALLVTLSPYLSDAPVVFNMPWSRRKGLPDGFERTAGNMVEYLPLRLHYDGEFRFRELVASVSNERDRARAHFLPLGFLLDQLGLVWEHDPTPLVQVQVNLVPPIAAPAVLTAKPSPLPLSERVEIHPTPPIGRTLERHDIGLVATATRKGLRWRTGLRHDLFTPELHDQLDRTLADVIERGLNDVGTWVADLARAGGPSTDRADVPPQPSP